MLFRAVSQIIFTPFPISSLLERFSILCFLNLFMIQCFVTFEFELGLVNSHWFEALINPISRLCLNHDVAFLGSSSLNLFCIVLRNLHRTRNIIFWHLSFKFLSLLAAALQDHLEGLQ
jgi:hypothetical protein